MPVGGGRFCIKPWENGKLKISKSIVQRKLERAERQRSAGVAAAAAHIHTHIPRELKMMIIGINLIVLFYFSFFLFPSFASQKLLIVQNITRKGILFDFAHFAHYNNINQSKSNVVGGGKT